MTTKYTLTTQIIQKKHTMRKPDIKAAPESKPLHSQRADNQRQLKEN